MKQHIGLDILIPPQDEAPKPTAEDWRRWDTRLTTMTWIEQEILYKVHYAAQPENWDEIERDLRRWGGTWLALRDMRRPGTPEWVSAQIEASMPVPRSACPACGSTDATHQPWCPSHPDFD